jgi:hypothetical protein
MMFFVLWGFVMSGFKPKKYSVVLTVETRERLEAITRNGSSPAKRILHARVLCY